MRRVYPGPEEILFYDGLYFSVEWYYTSQTLITSTLRR